jgi:hypothetical protein
VEEEELIHFVDGTAFVGVAVILLLSWIFWNSSASIPSGTIGLTCKPSWSELTHPSRHIIIKEDMA